jgi:hypothetical protein
LFADLPEVMKERPAINIEGILYVLEERTLSSLCDVIVRAWVSHLRVWDADGDFIFLLSVRNCRFRRLDNSEFDKL